MTTTVANQPTSAPNRKVSAGAGAGLPIGIVLVWALGEAGVEMPAEVGAAIGTIMTTFIAYMTRER